MFTYVAFKMLQQAGYKVEPADRIPGLWNVEGLANDVTTGQLCDLAERYGAAWLPPLSVYYINHSVS